MSAPGMGAPTTLLRRLAKSAAGAHWQLSSGLLLGEYPFLEAIEAGELAYRTWHVMAPVRDQVNAGTAGFVPIRASSVGSLLRAERPDFALVRVSPPDRNGFCSLGASAGYAQDAVHAAGSTIAEVDPAVPRTAGASLVHVSNFRALVETETAIPEYHDAESTDVSDLIAAKILDLLPPDLVLQVGIGAIPETLVRRLPDADLGRIRFVGMGTDSMVDLFARGALRWEDVVPDPAILSPDLMGTAKLLSFVDDNPTVGMYPSAVSHDAAKLGRLPRFVSVNTALEIDLTGNVNSEVIRGRQISGPGGALDYADAAGRSEGGLRVIAIPSTTPDGAHSRIVPRVESVTIPRTSVDVVVTEYGVAWMRGASVAERAERLAEVAHPTFRTGLIGASGS